MHEEKLASILGSRNTLEGLHSTLCSEHSMSDASFSRLRSALNLTVLVAALGYFVDIFDLLLFGIVRVPSLRALGVTESQLLEIGGLIDNTQTIGLLLGGILWGVLGDKRGRLSVLFGSIALYSLSNIANAFVGHMPGLSPLAWYGIWRFLAGLGLAGELGAAITLVSEVLPKESRGFGTAIVAAVGVSGAVVANLVAKKFNWQGAYLVGGGLGLMLLITRISVAESGMFHKTTESTVSRGDFRMLFQSRERFLRYLRCIAIGIPLWFGVGILMKFSPEFARALNVQGSVAAGDAIAYCYAGLVLGDFGSGFLSQALHSRKKVVGLFLGLSLLCILIYLFTSGLTRNQFMMVCFLCGVAFGYWAVFVTIAAEQFGTNLRATVATTTPNFVRGSVTPMFLSFLWLKGHVGVIRAALTVGLIVLALAFWSLAFMDETHGRDLDFVEEH
jgi:MFS transporter, putative metabolite:H+ symporter